MSDRLRIAVFAGSFPVPSETFILNQVVELMKRGHEVEVFAYRFKGPSVLHPAFTEFGLAQHVHHPWKIAPWLPVRAALGAACALTVPGPRARLAVARDARRYGWMAESWHLHYWACLLARESRPFDVVHAHFASVGGLCGMLQDAGLLPAPIVTSFHGVDVTAAPSGAEEVLCSFARSRSALYTFNTKFIAGKAEAMGFRGDLMRHLPVGLDVAKFPFVERGPHEGRLRILSVARLEEAKGIHVALPAMALLQERGIDFHYTVLGEGPWRAKLEALAGQLGLSDRVSFPGWTPQDEVQRAMRDADIFVLPSITGSDGRTEGQGLALQEAQATGLPVVATYHNGFPENIESGRTGFLVPENDPEALAGALAELCGSLQLRRDIGAAARGYVEKRFDSASLASAHETILREAVALGPRRGGA